MFLALSLNRDIQPVLTTIRALAERFIRDEDGHLASLIEAAIPALDRDPGLGEWLITEVTALARRKAVPPDQSRILERHLYQVVLKLAPIRRDVNRARAIRLEMAGSFEKEAEEREGESALIQSAILQDAIQGYQEAGDSEAVARLKPALHAATQRAAENLHTISTEITVPTDVFRKHVEACLTEGQKHGPAFHLHLFAMNEGLWPRWSDVSKRTAEMNQEFPIQALVRKTTLTHDGRPHERPEEPDKRREYDEIHRYVEDLQFQLAFTARKMEMFRERNAWNEALFIDALAEGVLFDKEIIEAVRPGIQAFEAKWNWEAIHVLIPQVERIVRKLAKTLGAETVRYVPATGELHWTSLKILLSVPSVKQVLASVSQDFAAELGYLLIDSRGLNLRDDVAHGILPVDTDHHRLALLCVLIMLTLSTLVRGGDAAASDTPEVQ